MTFATKLLFSTHVVFGILCVEYLPLLAQSNCQSDKTFGDEIRKIAFSQLSESFPPQLLADQTTTDTHKKST